MRAFTLMLCCVSNGLIYYQFLDGANNQWITIHWLAKLFGSLDVDMPGWREFADFCYDSMAAHTAATTSAVLRNYRVPQLRSAAAAFLCLPVESLAMVLKA